MLKTIFLTASKGDEGINMPHIMRIIFLSKFSDLTMLITSVADFDRYLSPETKTVRSPFSGKFGLIVLASYWLFTHRKNLSDYILVSEPTVLGIVGFLAKLFTNIKWVVDVWDIPIRHHGNSSKLTELRIWVTRRLMKVAYRKADLFIVGIRPEFQFRYYDIPEKKILAWQTTIWIPKKSEDNLADVGDQYFNILCMKSLHTPSCGLDVLMKAFLIVRKQIDNVRLRIIGKVREDVEEAIKGLGKIEDVEFYGFLEHSKVMRLIRQAQLCVIPWHNDVDLAQLFPTKVMEYMTEGKIVLAAAVAGISDMIRDGEDGVLYRPGDPDDLADKIMSLYKDKALRQRLADNARRYHRKFDTVCQHEEIFKALQRLVNDTSNIDVHTIERRYA
jgi:glycosyltransferase involved in cell wall biosynthesis